MSTYNLPRKAKQRKYMCSSNTSGASSTFVGRRTHTITDHTNDSPQVMKDVER